MESFLQIYFIDGIVGEKGNFLILHKILEKLVERNENPHYIIFIKKRSGKEKSMGFIESENGFYSNLYRLTLTSKFLVIDGKSKQVKLLCMHCRRSTSSSPSSSGNQFRIIESGKIKSLEDLNHLWYETHRNLEGRPIESLKYRRKEDEEMNLYQMSGCGSYKYNYRGESGLDANICAQLAISSSLNYTPFTRSQDYRIYGHIKSGMMSYSEYNDQMFLQEKSKSKYVALKHE